MSNRLIDIDIAKGICIVLVVTGHYVPADAPGWYLTLVNIIYKFHMPLFMFASGLVHQATKKPVPYKRFIWKKFKRLGIPYILVSLMIICIKLLSDNKMYLAHPVSLSSFYEILYLPSAGFFLWFVYVLFLIFLIIPFFDTPRKINFLLALSLAALIIPIQTTDLFCLAQFKSNLFYFVAGCFVSQYQRIIRQKTAHISVFFPLLGFAGLYLIARFYVHLPLVINCINVCLALTGIGVTLKISRFIELKTLKLKPVFLKLALYSYTIYLFHTSFQGIVKAFFFKYPLTGFLGIHASFVMMVLIAVSAGLVGPILLHVGYDLFINRKRLFGDKPPVEGR